MREKRGEERDAGNLVTSLPLSGVERVKATKEKPM